MFAIASLLDDALVGGTFVSLSHGKPAALLSSFILSWFPWAADWRVLPYTALPVGWLADPDSQDSRGKKVETAESNKISKICKTTSHNLENFYSLTLLNHCSSLEPCALRCEWRALIIGTARGDWFLWSRDQVGRRTLQVPFGPQWKDRQNLSQIVPQFFCMTLVFSRNTATSWVMTDILYMEHLLCVFVAHPLPVCKVP